MSIITTIVQNFKEYPSTSGIIASISTLFTTSIAFLSKDETVRLIGSIGGLMGIVLTLLTIYYKVKNEQLKRRP